MEDVKKWLIGLNLAAYYDGFIENGYDDLDAIKCLEDEDLDAIGIINPAHRQMIKGSSQQEEEQPPANEDLDALNFDNVLSDLDTIIGELGAFGNQGSAISKPVTAPKPTVAPRPTTAPKPAPKPATKPPPSAVASVESNSTAESKTSSVFVETETGQTRMVASEQAAEDFDLDSLLYDIVKFDPHKAVQQQQQTQPQQMSLPVANNVQQEMSTDMTDSGAPPSANNLQSPQDESIESYKMPDFRSASMMISEVEVKQRLDKLTEELHQNESLTEEEIEQKIKDEKMRIALEKMKLANVKKVAVKVFNVDGGSKTVVIEAGMTAAVVCHMLIVKNNCLEDPKWSLVEKWEELGIERVIEDHEIVIDIYSTWPRQNSNTFIFKKLETKFDLFENPTAYFPNHLSLSAESAYKHGAQERAEKARKILLQEYFSSTHRVPDIEGILYSKEGYKKPWKKYFFILRSSGLYYSIKGKSKLPKNLRVFVQFEGHDVYYGMGLKKLLAAPSDHCFCLKASVPATPSMPPRDAKAFSAESEQLLKTWVAGIRLAKYGLQLKENYSNSYVKQFKREELESGGEKSAEQRQQKLPGMIVEGHLDKVRQDYQQQQEQLQQQQLKQQQLQQQQLQQQQLQQQQLQQQQQQLQQQQLQQQQEQEQRQKMLLLQQQRQQQEQQLLLQQQLQQKQMKEQEQRSQHLMQQMTSPPSTPNRPTFQTVNKINTEHPNNTSPVNHRANRELPPIPTRHTSVPSNQTPTHAGSPYPMSSSVPVSNSHFAVSPPHHPPPQHHQQPQQYQQQQQPGSLQSYPWYHGDISRDIAVKRLEEFSMKDGTFLIRQSKSCIGTYVLTMAAEGIIRNFQIQPNRCMVRGCHEYKLVWDDPFVGEDLLFEREIGNPHDMHAVAGSELRRLLMHPGSVSAPVLYRIDDGPEFSTIQQLIDHYTVDSDRLPCKLSCFCPK